MNSIILIPSKPFEIQISLRYNPLNYSFFFFFFLACLPKANSKGSFLFQTKKGRICYLKSSPRKLTALFFLPLPPIFFCFFFLEFCMQFIINNFVVSGKILQQTQVIKMELSRLQL